MYESLFIEITDTRGKKVLIGSAYRPGSTHPTLSYNDQMSQFLELLTNSLDNLSNSKIPVYLFGDMNIDALKYNLSADVNDYIDMLFSNGFLQVITKPTRCTPKSGKLIDHCITNSNSNQHTSVIITTKISDHFPILYTVSNQFKKKNTSNCFIS